MTARGRVVVLALLAALAPVASTAGAAEPPSEPATEPAPEAVEKEAAARTDRLLRNLWWNQPEVIEALELDAAQRSAMDGAFTRFLTERRARRADFGGPVAAYREALGRGDLAAAREAVALRAERAAAAATAEPTMVLEVLAALRPAQLGKLREKYPKLLASPWLKVVGEPVAGSGRRRIRRRPPAAGGPSTPAAPAGEAADPGGATGGG